MEAIRDASLSFVQEAKTVRRPSQSGVRERGDGGHAASSDEDEEEADEFLPETALVAFRGMLDIAGGLLSEVDSMRGFSEVQA